MDAKSSAEPSAVTIRKTGHIEMHQETTHHPLRLPGMSMDFETRPQNHYPAWALPAQGCGLWILARLTADSISPSSPSSIL